MVSIRKAMETADHCVLRYLPGRGWAAANTEFVSNRELRWFSNPKLAVTLLLHRTGHTLSILPDIVEKVTVSEVEHLAEPWRAEWKDDKWIQKFELNNELATDAATT